MVVSSCGEPTFDSHLLINHKIQIADKWKLNGALIRFEIAIEMFTWKNSWQIDCR